MIQKKIIRIAFLGPLGSYSHLAAQKYSVIKQFDQILECSYHTFHDIINVVQKGNVEYGILPIENSNSGLIIEVYNLLKNATLSTIDELYLPIDHCILTIKDTIKIEEIQTVYSHIQPFKQCSQFFQNFSQCKIQYCHSTSDAMRTVMQMNLPNAVAIGSGRNSILYNLKILKNNIANCKNNITRFIILTR